MLVNNAVDRCCEVPLPPVVYEAGKRIAAASESGKLLVFDIDEMRAVARGRGVIIMGLDDKEELAAVAVLPGSALVMVWTGRGGKEKRLELSGAKLSSYYGKRARMGRVLPDRMRPSAIEVPTKE